MKLSEIGRYCAAKNVVEMEREGNSIVMRTPVITPLFTIRIPGAAGPVRVRPLESGPQAAKPLREVASPAALDAGTWVAEGTDLIVCVDLEGSGTRLEVGG